MPDFDRTDTGFSVKLFEHFRQLTYDLSKNPEVAHKWSFLRYYQKIIRDYFLSVKTQSRGLLINLPPGMGKTLIAVAVAMDHMEDKFPIILASKSLHINFVTGIKKYIKMRAEVDSEFAIGKLPEEDLDKWIAKNFGFVSMNASNMIDQLIKESEGLVGKEFRRVQSKVERKRAKEGQYKAAAAIGSLDGKFLIVDEAHNLFRSITNGSKNGIDLYNMVMHSHDLKIIFLTGTIPVNDPFEYVPCFNMLAGTPAATPLFPESYGDFRRAFISERQVLPATTTSTAQESPSGVTAGSKLTMINKDKFQNRIYGLVSHVGYNTMLGKGIIDMAQRQGEDVDFSSIGLTGEQQPVNFPKVLPMVVKFIQMSPQQYSMYMIAKNKEAEEYKVKRFRKGSSPIMQKPKSMSASTYKQKSRQMSNFAPPSELGLVKFSEINMDKIPDNQVVGVKLSALDEYINSIDGIGYVYSQFVGAGGLGSIMRYLEKKGWTLFSGQKKMQTGIPPKKKQGKITTAIASDFEDAVMADNAMENTAAEGGGNGEVGNITRSEKRIRKFTEYLSGFENNVQDAANARNATITIYFIVNGQTDLCAEGRQIGASTSESAHLNAKGKQQAKTLAKAINKYDLIKFDKSDELNAVDEIYVAGAARSHDLFNIIQKANPGLSMDDVIMSEELSPRNGGILDGMKLEDVKALLDEAGRTADEGLVGLTKEQIIDIADNSNVEMEKDTVSASMLTNEESETNFRDRIKNEITKIISREERKLKKHQDQFANKPSSRNILIIAPNNVYTTAATFLLNRGGVTVESVNILDTPPVYAPKIICGDVKENLPTIIEKYTLVASTKLSANIIGGGKESDGNGSSNATNSLKTLIGYDLLNLLNETSRGCEIRGGGSEKNSDNNKRAKSNKTKTSGKVFAYFSGEVDMEDRENIRRTFNNIKNATGEDIKLLLISSTGAEGLDLENARFGIVYEPYWVWSRNKQVFARGVRHNSHIKLPTAKQNFQPVMFVAVLPPNQGADNVNYEEYVSRMVAGKPIPGDEALLTTDLELYIESLITEDINSQFSEATGEVSIECVLNGEHNCRMCAPNSSKLFGNDFDADMRRPNSCEKYEEELTEVKAVEVDGETYYYTEDPGSIFGYKVFEYDSALGNYREMEKSNELYSQITDLIDSNVKMSKK